MSACNEEIVEMVPRCSSVGRRRSSRGSSPQASFVFPRSRSSTTILLRSASRTLPLESQLDEENVKNNLFIAHNAVAEEFKDKERPRLDRQPNPNYLHMGATELTKASAWQGTLVEFTGSLVLTFVSVAAVIACLKAQFKFPRIAVALTQFLIYTVCILATAPVSGGHLNPCFSFTTMLTGHTSFVRSMLYIVAQSAGSVLGAFFVKVVVSSDVSHTYFLGGCLLRQQMLGANQTINSLGVDPGPGLVSEVIFTFLLISVAFPLILEYSTTTDFGDPRLVKGAFITGLLLGLLIFVSGELLAPGYTSAGMNPARCLGPAMAHGGASLWRSQWVFWLGPLLAGIFFAMLYRVVHWRPYASESQPFVTAEAQRKLPIIIEPSQAKERADFVAQAPSAVPNTEGSCPTPSLQASKIMPVASPQAQLNSARRMDVFLHIKTIMQKQENEKGVVTTWAASEVEEEPDVEQSALIVKNQAIEQRPTTSSETSVVMVDNQP